MEKTEIQSVNYILTKFNNTLSDTKLYGLMYLIQKDYLSTYGKRVFDDFFVIKGDYIRPYHLYREGPKIFNTFYDGTVRNYQTDKITDMDYIAVAETHMIDKWCMECENLSDSEMKEKIRDFAIVKAINRIRQDPDLGIVTDIDIATAGGAGSDLIDYIIENKLLFRTLGAD